jgi:hypothetical protein
MQVYSEQQKQLLGVFIAIIVMAYYFLTLEYLQFFSNRGDYFRQVVTLNYITAGHCVQKLTYGRYSLRSVYNWMDIIVFTLPLAGSVCQILNITIEGADYNTSTLSFSVLFIFLHFVRKTIRGFLHTILHLEYLI